MNFFKTLLKSAVMIWRARSFSVPELLLVSFLSVSTLASSQTKKDQTKAYPLSTLRNDGTCGSKGRFQDRFYWSQALMDRIVADGKSAIPVLISQITDSRLIATPIYCFWPPIRTGELAHFILQGLFVDENWQHRTMPALFPPEKCDGPAWECWARFRKRHSLVEIQTRWRSFWETNKDRIYWDEKARCFRVTGFKPVDAAGVL